MDEMNKDHMINEDSKQVNDSKIVAIVIDLVSALLIKIISSKTNESYHLAVEPQ